MYQKVTLLGRLGSEPEMRYTPQGTAVASFSLAINERYTASDGEKKENTTWFKVTCWNRLAEIANEYLHSGDQTFIEGRVALTQWTGSDGVNRARLDITANRLVLLGGNRRDGGDADAEDYSDVPSKSEMPNAPYCEEHHIAFQKHTNEKGMWYSHSYKVKGQTKWCNYKPEDSSPAPSGEEVPF